MGHWSQKSLRSPQTLQAFAIPLDHSPKLADKILLEMAHIFVARTGEIKVGFRALKGVMRATEGEKASI